MEQMLFLQKKQSQYYSTSAEIEVHILIYQSNFMRFPFNFNAIMMNSIIMLWFEHNNLIQN